MNVGDLMKRLSKLKNKRFSVKVVDQEHGKGLVIEDPTCPESDPYNRIVDFIEIEDNKKRLLW